MVLVHIGGAVSPDAPGHRRAVPGAAASGSSRTPPTPTAASFDGRSAGTFGVAGGFSFYPTKVVTSGEGGMIATADPRIREEAIIHRDQGKAGFLGGDHVRLGSAWRMSEVHAAIGLVHLRRLRRVHRPPGRGGRAVRPRARRHPRDHGAARGRGAPTSTSTSPSSTPGSTAPRSSRRCATSRRHDEWRGVRQPAARPARVRRLSRASTRPLPVAEDVVPTARVPAPALRHDRRRGDPRA